MNDIRDKRPTIGYNTSDSWSLNKKGVPLTGFASCPNAVMLLEPHNRELLITLFHFPKSYYKDKEQLNKTITRCCRPRKR